MGTSPSATRTGVLRCHHIDMQGTGQKSQRVNTFEAIAMRCLKKIGFLLSDPTSGSICSLHRESLENHLLSISCDQTSFHSTPRGLHQHLGNIPKRCPDRATANVMWVASAAQEKHFACGAFRLSFFPSGNFRHLSKHTCGRPRRAHCAGTRAGTVPLTRSKTKHI